MTTTHFDQLQLAERWGLSPKTLERWRVIGTGPKYIRLPGKVIYRLCDIEAYENRIKILQTLNEKYREKLGISNEPVDAINAVNECNHENIQMKSSGIWKCKCGYKHF